MSHPNRPAGGVCPRCERIEPPTVDWEWYPWYGVLSVCGECADDLAEEETETSGYDCSDYLGYEED